MEVVATNKRLWEDSGLLMVVVLVSFHPSELHCEAPSFELLQYVSAFYAEVIVSLVASGFVEGLDSSQGRLAVASDGDSTGCYVEAFHEGSRHDQDSHQSCEFTSKG